MSRGVAFIIIIKIAQLYSCESTSRGSQVFPRTRTDISIFKFDLETLDEGLATLCIYSRTSLLRTPRGQE